MKLASEMKPDDYVIEKEYGKQINVIEFAQEGDRYRDPDHVPLKEQWKAERIRHQVRSIELAIGASAFLYLMVRILMSLS